MRVNSHQRVPAPDTRVAPPAAIPPALPQNLRQIANAAQQPPSASIVTPAAPPQRINQPKADYIFHLEKWRDMSQVERDAWPDSRHYANASNALNPAYWRRLVNKNGLSPMGSIRLLDAQIKPQDKDKNYPHHLRCWRDMSADDRSHFRGASDYARTHQLNRTKWQRLANDRGLTARGSAQLLPPAMTDVDWGYHCQQWQRTRERGPASNEELLAYATTNKLHPKRWLLYAGKQGLLQRGHAKLAAWQNPQPVDLRLLSQQWAEMTQTARDEAGGAIGFAIKKAANPDAWYQLATNDGLTSKGTELLVSLHKYQADPFFHCGQWQEMSVEQRQQTGIDQYAAQNQLRADRWRELVDLNGLTPAATTKMHPSAEVDMLPFLRQWQNMETRDQTALGALKWFAFDNNLPFALLQPLANNRGLTAAGKRKLTASMIIEDGRPPQQVAQTLPRFLQQWRDMSQEQREQAGGVTRFAADHDIDPVAWKQRVNTRGLRPQGKYQLNPEGYVRSTRVVIPALTAWQQKTQHARDQAGGSEEYGDSQKIKPGTWRTLATNNGLTAAGEKKLAAAIARIQGESTEAVQQLKRWADMSQPSRRRIPRDPETSRLPSAWLMQWRDMTPEQRDLAGGVYQFAATHQIKPAVWVKRVNAQGLRPQGKYQLNPELYSLDKLPPALKEWQQKTQLQRDNAGGAEEYGDQMKIKPVTWRYLANNSGLTAAGERKLAILNASENAEQTDVIQHLRNWLAMSPLQRDREGGWLGYGKQRMAGSKWRQLTTASGLTRLGEICLKAEIPQTSGSFKELINQWFALPLAQRSEPGALSQFAREHNQKGFLSHIRRYEYKNNPVLVEPPTVVIKTEPPSPTDDHHASIPLLTVDQHGNTIEARATHARRQQSRQEIRNDYPILRDPQHPHLSLTATLGAPELLTVDDWGALAEPFSSMSEAQVAACKAALLVQFRAITRQDNGQDLTAGKRMVLQGTHHQAGEEIISLGNGVFNLSGNVVSQFTVLGPYAGSWHTDKSVSGKRGTLSKERVRHGTRKVLTYLFGSGSAQRVVSAVDSGNILSKINCGQLPGQAKIADNNVASVRFNDIHFFVTTRDVSHGEEYFLDYGDHYDPGFVIAQAQAQEARRIKTRARKRARKERITIIKATRKIKLEAQERATAAAEAYPTLYCRAEEIADTLIRPAGAWRSQVADMVPVILMDSATLPANMVLTIQRDSLTHIFTTATAQRICHGAYQPQPGELHIQLQLSGEEGAEHYQVIRGNRFMPNPPDGDCFYRAVSQGLRLQGIADFDILRLRNIAAATFLRHSARYVQNIDAEKLKVEMAAEKQRQGLTV